MSRDTSAGVASLSQICDAFGISRQRTTRPGMRGTTQAQRLRARRGQGPGPRRSSSLPRSRRA